MRTRMQEVAGTGYVTQPGDIKYVDVSGDGVVNSNDMTYLGNGNIPEIIYGINGALNWKNLDFSFLFQGAALRCKFICRVELFNLTSIREIFLNFG